MHEMILSGREKGRVVLEDLLKGKPLSAAVDEPGVKAKARVITLPLDEGESSSAEASPAQQRKGTVLKSSLSTEAPDVILDLESPDHKSRRSSSIRLHGAQVRAVQTLSRPACLLRDRMPSRA